MSFGIFTFNVCAYTEAPIDILNLTVEEIQNYVDKKVINYEMLTQLYLDRIEVYENTYNAIISINENALEEEFRNIYNMYVITIPTNKPVVREDYPDLVYTTENGKYTSIINKIKEVYCTEYQ